MSSPNKQPMPKPIKNDSVSKNQSFQEWAMAGGGVPLQYKGREHVWHKKAKQYAEGGSVDMAGGGIAKLLKAAKTAKQAPAVVVPSRLSELQAEVAQKSGQYGAKRVQRAADEVKNLERMYRPDALRQVFIGDNAKALVTMNPADFEKYAEKLKGRTRADIGPKTAELAKRGQIDKYTVPTDEYIQHLMRVQGGFDDVPYLNLRKDEIGLPMFPNVTGHEGRHRSRALAEMGEPSSLVNIQPSGGLREDLPRRSREEFIEALRKELDLKDRLVIGQDDINVLQLPEVYAEGGDVHMAEGGAAFGVFPQMKPRRSKQDPEAAKNFPVDLARGFAAGVLGAPGDIESFARLPYELITGKNSPTFLPTSEDIEKRLPFRSEAPISRAASGAGQLAGGFYMGPGSPLRAAGAIPGAIKHGAQEFAMAAGQSGPKMFIGPKAKTWNQAKADAAARMEKAGVDPVEIFRETGTFRGADGIPRQEISDAGAVFRGPGELKELSKQKKQEALDLGMRLITPAGQKDMFPKALTEAKKPAFDQITHLRDEADELMRDPEYRGQRAKFVLDHPELYKAYPELGEIPVTQGRQGSMGERASVRGTGGDMQMEITQKGLGGNPKSSILHEMQHGVQNLEGMAPGGNTVTAFQNPEAHKILEDLRKAARTPISFDDFIKNGGYSYDPETLARAWTEYKDYADDVPLLAKQYDRDNQQRAAEEYYTRLAGEAEARATQAREPMSASQRAREFPYSSYDVLPENLIVKDPQMAAGGAIKEALKKLLNPKAAGGEVKMSGGGSGDSIRPTDVKNKGALGVSKALRKAHEFASKPFGYANPPGEMISEFLGVPAVSRTLERVGYGEPLTTGKGMTLRPRDDTTEALLSVLPMAPATKGLPVGAATKKVAGEAALPLRLPRAVPKSAEEINAHAERVARQMMGEHVMSGRPGDTQNLAGRSKKESQRVKNLEYELAPTKVVPESQVVEPRIGDVNVALPGDYTVSDVELKTLMGEPIGSRQEGGSRYGLGHMDKSVPNFWASGEVPAQMAQNKITDVAELFDPERVMAQHLAMGPVATNFAQHFADANLKAIDYSKLRPRDMDSFDRVIANGYTKKNKKTGEVEVFDFPDWPGIADPAAAYEAMKINPELRKWFNSRMKTPDVTQPLGLPNGLDVQWAITHPELRNMEVNLTGHSVGEMMPGAALTDTAEHNTYLKGIPGIYRGHNEVLTPFGIAYPDATEHMISTQSPQSFTSTIQKVFPHQRVDQQYIDEYNAYRERVKKLTGKKKGGVVSGLATVNKLCGCHD